jgi:hypothetical protein
MRKSLGPKSVRQLLNRFGIATILAGVGLSALARPVTAEIVYTPANIIIGANSSYNLDLDNDGVTDFTISTSYSTLVDSGFQESFGETPASGNGAERTAHYPSPNRVAGGKQIGPSQTFYGGTLDLAVYGLYCGPVSGCEYNGGGNWFIRKCKWVGHVEVCTYKGGTGFLGLMFQINGETHYGWALLTVNLGPPGFVTLNGYAYETIPNMPINAGQTK